MILSQQRILFSTMDLIIKAPGLNHILETILAHLDNEDIVKFGKVNKESGEIVEGIAKHPWFWLKKCFKNGGIPQQHHENWTKLMKILARLDNEDIVKLGKVNKESGEIVEGIAKRPWFWFKKCRKNGGIPQQHHENSTEVMKILGKPNQPQNLTKNVDQVHSAINEMLELANKVELKTEILNMLSALYGNIVALYPACVNSDQIDQEAYATLFHKIFAQIIKEGNELALRTLIPLMVVGQLDEPIPFGQLDDIPTIPKGYNAIAMAAIKNDLSSFAKHTQPQIGFKNPIK